VSDFDRSSRHLPRKAEALEGGVVVKLSGTDLVAIVALCVCGLLVYSGHNGMIVSLIATIIGWYFGRQTKRAESEEEKE